MRSADPSTDGVVSPAGSAPQTLRIEYLADHVDAIPVLARWHHDQWAAITPGVSLAERIQRFEARARRSGLPTGFVAVAGAEVVGVASLVSCDLDSHPHFTPWLASVLVSPAHRGRGIGSALCERVAGEARGLGFSSMYLLTFDKQRFYGRLGWSVLEPGLHFGLPATIMAKTLSGGGALR